MQQSQEQARQTICDIGKLLYNKELITGTEGNISCRLSDNSILITPSGVCKGLMRPDQIVQIDRNGGPTESHQQPSSEFQVHLAAYNSRKDISAVVHAHPNYATAVAMVGVDFSGAKLPEFDATFGFIPLIDFREPGTAELAEDYADAVREYHTCLLQGHGIVSVGADLWEAFHRVDMAEHCYKTLYLAEQLMMLRECVDELTDLDDLEEMDDLEDELPPAVPIPTRRRRDN